MSAAQQAHLEQYRAGMVSTVRDLGQQAALNFDSIWRDAALEELERLASNGTDFCADDLVAEVGQPDSPGAVGAAISKAAKSGLIRHVGYRTAAASVGMADS